MDRIVNMTTTPASKVLRSIMSSSSSGKITKTTRHQHHKKKPYDDNSSTSEDEPQQQQQDLATRKLRRMKLECLDPFRYYYTRLCGRGDIIRALGGNGIIGERAPLASPTDPQFMQRGPRKFGGSQPGSERLNFLPQPDIFTLIKSDKLIYITPNQTPVPGFSDLIHFELEQQPGLFYDGQTFELIGMLQMYHKDRPWHEGGTDVAVKESTRKCISPINNIFASLFKSLTVTVNNQALITFDYSHISYLSTLLETDLDDYENGALSDQGFFKETAGHLAEWNCHTADGQEPKNDNNSARAELCKLFFSGAEREFRMRLKFPITDAFDKTPLNCSNRIGFSFARHANTFYLLSGPDNTTVTGLDKDIATVAADCKIRINKLQLRARLVEYDSTVLENYVNTFTNVQPDAYQFPYHQIQSHSYQNNNRFYTFQVNTDTVPDKIAFSFINKNARIGTITSNPWIMPKLPKDAKWKISVNNGSSEPNPYVNTRQLYDQFQKTLLINNPKPLISRYDYQVNDKTNASDCQYNMYCETLTYTSMNRDGSLCLDTRQASVTIEIEIAVGPNLGADNELLVHKFDTRRCAFQPNGVIIRDFPR